MPDAAKYPAALSARLNDETDPARAEKFFAIIDRFGLNTATVTKGLVDAFIDYVEERDHTPPLPFNLAGTTPRNVSPSLNEETKPRPRVIKR